MFEHLDLFIPPVFSQENRYGEMGQRPGSGWMGGIREGCFNTGESGGASMECEILENISTGGDRLEEAVCGGS